MDNRGRGRRGRGRGSPRAQELRERLGIPDRDQVYISGDRRVLPTQEDAWAATANAEQVKGLGPCQNRLEDLPDRG